MREKYRHEIVVGLIAGVLTVFCPAFFPVANRCGGAMMAIGNKKRRYSGKPCTDFIHYLLVRHLPELMGNSITDEIDDRFTCTLPFHKRCELLFCTVGQEYRPGLCLDRLHVPYAVIFFLRAGQFMFANDIVFIVIGTD